MPLIHQKDEFLKNLANMIKGAQILEVPILWSEHAPEHIGKTIPQISKLLASMKPIEKISFSCCGDANFMQALGMLKRKQILICGIEAHICIYQTAMDLINLGYDVSVVADCVSSRTEKNKQIGLERIKELGGMLTSIEMALCELLRIAEGEKFRKILEIIK